MQPRRTSTGRPLPAGKPPVRANIPAAIAIAVVVLAVAWFFLSSPYSNVANLASRGTNVIAFGDSLTAGYGAAAGEDYPAKLSSLVDRPVINAGVSGDTTDSALARIDRDVLGRDPRIVIVGLGGNDYLRSSPASSTEANLRQIVRKIQAAGAMVVVLGFDFPSLTADYGKMYTRIAKEERCLLIPNVVKGILNNPKLKSDEIHPNAQGYQRMAERIAPKLEKLIRKADKAR